MKKLYVLLLTALFTGSTVYAEGWHGKHRGKHMDKLTQELQLNDDQKQSVESIINEQMAKGQELRESIRKQVQPQMQALHDETRQRLAGVLDDQQLQKFDELSAKRHEKMRKRFRHGSNE